MHDPDGNMWEVYTLEEDIEHRGDGLLPVIEPERKNGEPLDPAASIWNHRLGQPFPKRLPILDATVDYVSLQGTFNEKLSTEATSARLQEVLRILKPSGRVHLHLLTADRPLSDAPISLPGPAAPVKQVPVDQEMLRLLGEIGFLEPRYVYHASSPCFHIGEAELRETRIEAIR